jgi:hypothetical protein
MWNITSSGVQRAKDELMARRTEFETRYAEERQALDAELAVIETLERAASEFILRHARKAGTVAADPVPPVASGDADAAENAADHGAREEPALAAEPAGAESAPAAIAVLPPTAETEPAGAGDTAGGLEILKPGSRWRFYRGGGSHPSDAEGNAGEAVSSDG